MFTQFSLCQTWRIYNWFSCTEYEKHGFQNISKPFTTCLNWRFSKYIIYAVTTFPTLIQNPNCSHYAQLKNKSTFHIMRCKGTCMQALTSAAHPHCCKQSLLQLKQDLVRLPSMNVRLSLSSLKTVHKLHKAPEQLRLWSNWNTK